MPALMPTEYTARVTWIGVVGNRDAALASSALKSVQALFDGPVGESHGGLTRPSCSRVLKQHPRNTEIRNVRQFSIISAEELAEIAHRMELAELDPSLLGATLVVKGIPDFTRVPPSSRLQGPDGVTLTVDMENRPCTLPARVIEDAMPGYGKRFKPASLGRRGVTAWVEREGTISVGDEMRLHIPDQPVWSCLGKARRGKTDLAETT
ncbi:MOSC domain-containing protein [Pseudooceanicola sediminis]|uniref:MOSC domain-containing protein n=1 Tax=Pseudooceanicola sediminis TaxID=2211117 RepID=A0A399J3L7_9RHOB|nr:MOSC domain-containing protein [Pseudooceanicola sediminis]KAA2314120.1 MOSC domain-containing protein [Puniceibacterium sp. HSS470]RII40018.1 MOSC domain-containing protein [Pseudooceanicola sediminis]|tara:strand:+ start:82090 stop:82713 length:624 start_codon:yes stop_codon:yes gene_type:complete